MASLRAFERELKIATAGLEPQAINKLLAQTAHQALEEAQSAGEAPSSFIRYVNGREGVAEESVEAPGPIVYVFSWLNEVATYALAFAEERSPVLSGRFKSSWFVLVNGSLWGGEDIPPDPEIILTNDQPYARKIEIGRMVMRVPPGIVEDTRQAVMRRFGNVIQAQKRFIPLAGAYTLKTSSGRRKDRQAGRELSYPALVISQRF
jgi:hypothetical protein